MSRLLDPGRHLGVLCCGGVGASNMLLPSEGHLECVCCAEGGRMLGGEAEERPGTGKAVITRC
jgi:hypothetical protein